MRADVHGAAALARVDVDGAAAPTRADVTGLRLLRGGRRVRERRGRAALGAEGGAASASGGLVPIAEAE